MKHRFYRVVKQIASKPYEIIATSLSIVNFAPLKTVVFFSGNKEPRLFVTAFHKSDGEMPNFVTIMVCFAFWLATCKRSLQRFFYADLSWLSTCAQNQVTTVFVTPLRAPNISF